MVVKKAFLIIIMGLCLSGAGDSRDLMLAKGGPPSAGYLPNPPYVTYQEGVGLKEYFEYRLDALEKQIRQLLEARDKQVITLSDLMAERMKNFPSEFAKSGELIDIRSKIEILMSAKDVASGMATQNQWLFSLAVSVITGILALVSILLQFFRVKREK